MRDQEGLWRLIDLDASAQIGSITALKYSEAYLLPIPPYTPMPPPSHARPTCPPSSSWCYSPPGWTDAPQKGRSCEDYG